MFSQPVFSGCLFHPNDISAAGVDTLKDAFLSTEILLFWAARDHPIQYIRFTVQCRGDF